MGDASEGQDNPQTTGIKEEEEESRGIGQADGGPLNGASPASQQDLPPENGLRQPVNTDTVSAGVGKLSLNMQGNEGNPNGNAPHTPMDNSSGPPPGIVDISQIEWSYLDPQGQVQGMPSSHARKSSAKAFVQVPSLPLPCRSGMTMATSHRLCS